MHVDDEDHRIQANCPHRYNRNRDTPGTDKKHGHVNSGVAEKHPSARKVCV